MPDFDKNFRKIEQSDIKSKGVAALTDRPNDPSIYGKSGLSAPQLKAWFDKLSVILSDRVNAIIEGTQNGDLAEKLKLSKTDDMTLAVVYESILTGELAKKLTVYKNSGELLALQLYIDLLEQSLSKLDENISNIDSSILFLGEKDIELGTSISDSISSHNENVTSHLDIRNKINDDLSKHNTNTGAHQDIRRAIASALEKANNAYNLASGRAKVHPVQDAVHMVSLLSDEINVGDKFVLAEAKVPDFTLFAKNFEYDNDYNVDDISNEDIFTYNFVVGRNYHYNGYLLVPSESGIDTSAFAKASDLDEVQTNLIEQYDELNENVEMIESVLTDKESKKHVKTETAEAITVNNDTEYNLGLRTSVILNLPESVSSDYECIVNFRSGTTATTFDSPDEIIFTQDDCLDGKLYPVSNRLYEINIKNVGGVLVAKVGACDYAIL